MSNTLFTIPLERLEILDQYKAVDFFRRLLWNEADRIGIAKSLISVPDCINVADGGIDAYIEDANHSSDSIIPVGNTGFQIKAGDLEPADCSKELHLEKNTSKPIKPKIADLLNNNGTYVLVLFHKLEEGMRNRRKEAIIDELRNHGIESEKIQVLDIVDIAKYAESYPLLCIFLKYLFKINLEKMILILFVGN
jgi:hypothetical protein